MQASEQCGFHSPLLEQNRIKVQPNRKVIVRREGMQGALQTEECVLESHRPKEDCELLSRNSQDIWLQQELMHVWDV